jgi:hypothetical protein
MIIILIIFIILYFLIPCELYENFLSHISCVNNTTKTTIPGCCAKHKVYVEDCQYNVKGCEKPVHCEHPRIGPSEPMPHTSCFAGSELVLLDNKEYKPISDIIIGDKILTADKNFNLSFSPVIFLPHKKNNIETIFIQITSDTNKTIKLTPEHNIVANNKIIYASDVKIGDILQTINGQEIVKDISLVTNNGIYTAITNNEFIVVNDIIASPIAYVTHEEGTEFYKLLSDIQIENIDAGNKIHNIAHKLFDYAYLN